MPALSFCCPGPSSSPSCFFHCGKLADSIAGAGGSARVFQADVAQEDDVVRLFAEVDERLGPVNVLVNNAGIYGKRGPVRDLTSADIQRALDVNVVGQDIVSWSSAS